MKIKIPLLLIVTTILILEWQSISCSGPTESKDKVIEELLGKWDWIYSMDPRTGKREMPDSTSLSYLVFSENEVKYYENDTLTRSCIYITDVSTFKLDSFQTIKICKENLVFAIQKYDTLTLSYAATDGPIEKYIQNRRDLQ